MNGLSPYGLRWCQFIVRKEDGGLDWSGKSRVLDDTESSLGNADLLWPLCVGEFLLEAILPS